MRFGAFSIRSKIKAMIAAMAIVVITGCVCAAIQMLTIDRKYSDIIARVDSSATLAARGNRLLAQYGYLAYKLAAQTTDEGNAQMLAALKVNDAEYNDIQNKIRSNVPEYSSATSRIGNLAASALKACAGPIDFAGKTTKIEDVTTASLRLRAECDPQLDIAIRAQHEFADMLAADAYKKSDELALKTRSIIMTILGSVLAAFVIASGFGIWISMDKTARLTLRLRRVMQNLAP